MKPLPILILLVALGAGSALAQTTTNDFLFRQIQSWETSIEDGQAARVLEEIEASKQDPHGAAWETPVLAGPDWS